MGVGRLTCDRSITLLISLNKWTVSRNHGNRVEAGVIKSRQANKAVGVVSLIWDSQSF